MIALVICAGVVVALHEIARAIVIRRVGERSVSLGPFAEVRVISTRIWLMRGRRSPRVAAMWMVWLTCAASLAAAATAFPDIEALAGLLIGGSLAHAIDTSRHGKVSDYICLRFWPAFDVADLALAFGAAGIVLNIVWVHTAV